MEIRRGRIMKAVKTVIYGPEGIGKSTLASKFPDPVYIDTEGSTSYMDVARLPVPSSWQMLMSEVDDVKANPTCCKTIVIDTVDWAEQLCSQHICALKKVDGIESIGYGKGYVYMKEEFGKLLNKLSDLIDLNINVVLVAHAQMRKFEQPDELGAYDRWELKLSKQCAPLIKEWSDMLLFCNYKTFVVNVDNQGAAKGKNKARGGKRVIYTEHHPCWDAKNRFGLPDEIDMDYASIRPIIEGTAPAPVKAEAPMPAPAPKEVNQAPLIEKPKEEEKPINSAPAVAPAEVAMNPPVDEDPKVPAKSPEEAPAKEEAKPVSRYLSNPDRIPKNLRDLMERDHITEWDIQNVVMARGFYPDSTLIQDMNPDFVQGWIVVYWDKIKEMAMQIRDKEEVPFN